jgi:large subunit ribosomal protein L22
VITRALAKYIKISPKKMGPVAELVRTKKAGEALAILMNVNKKGAGILQNVISSAVNNARRIPEKNFEEEELYISKLVINMGPALKRYRAMSMGRAGLIKKRTSHILVELDAPKKASAAKSARGEKKAQKTKKLRRTGKR